MVEDFKKIVAKFYLFVIGCVLIDNANSDAQLHPDMTHLAPVEGDTNTRRPPLTTLYLAAQDE
jgi:hypothetical protein